MNPRTAVDALVDIHQIRSLNRLRRQNCRYGRQDNGTQPTAVASSNDRKDCCCERTSVRITKDEHLAPGYCALNPLGIVPTLVDRDTVVPQSIAIIEYLDELHPDPPLLPDTPQARARVRAPALAIACEIHPLNIGRVVTYLSGQLNMGAADIQRWGVHWLETGLGAVETLLNATPGTADFCQGDTPTLADVCLVPQAYSAMVRYKLDLAAYPTIARTYETCLAISAFAGAAPDNQPDAANG